MRDYRTPLSRARGLGAAKSGSGHFIAQRVSAMALFGLTPVFLVALAMHAETLETAVAFIAAPPGAILTLLTATAAIFHMRLGLQVTIEDYIRSGFGKALLLTANTLVCAGLWIVVLYSVFRLAS